MNLHTEEKEKPLNEVVVRKGSKSLMKRGFNRLEI